MHFFIKSTFLLIIYSIYFTGHIQAELKLLNVVFRHGDRAPTSTEAEIFRSLHRNDSFSIIGLGELTNKGKLKEFHLGQHLRRQYGDFLGDIYLGENVESRSTDTSRTKMSLQLVLAGLYPPKDVQRWNDDLNWQPIPFNYIPLTDDVLMFPFECPRYLDELERVERLPEVRRRSDYFKDLMNYLSIKTGEKIDDLFSMYALYNTLMARRSMQFELPSWTKGIFPYGQLYDAAVAEYDIYSYNDKLKRLNGGMLLRKIIANMYERAINASSKRKIHLYSGHEINIAALMQALNVYQYDAPEYTSAVIVELHQESKRHFVKIKYYKGLQANQSFDQELHNPHCRANCSLDDLKAILNNVIPSDEDIKCDKRSLLNHSNGTTNIARGIRKYVLERLTEEDKIRKVLP